ncbi:TonB-dependent receptor [Alteromonas lipolytica]|uniref:Uncharacterized protein n=1 Tax=Alteromonas lipolytica TaxID=1856405 RepID=A0A1E8FIB5_9ALTE|nr:TonB-dependent receptor [Alteromonas lipolytica]OFI35682.1 hypothetical protein BFC17_13105 [Alteromonas lipolytica]
MTKRSNMKLLARSVLATSVLCALNTAAFAQEQDGATPEDIERIGVTYRSSLAEAASMKKEETKVTDIITSEDIGKFPTENIAEAIQRIPGVQISNINGRGSTISVRGLGAQYARTTVNNQSMASADFTSGFRFDIIQSELASAIEVVKSPTADMDSGGLSGTININTTRPLSYDERKVLVSAKGQYSELSPSGDVTPKANVTYVDQFADETFGVFLNAGYQELDDRVDVMFMDRWLRDDNDNIYAEQPRYRRIDRETKRYMANGTFQYRPSDELEMVLTGIYVEDQTYNDLLQQVFSMSWMSEDLTPVGEPVGGAYYNTTVSDFVIGNNRQLEDQTAKTEALTFETTYDTDNWKLSGVLHHTKGTLDSSEEAAIVEAMIGGATMDLSNPDNVVFTTAEDLTDASIYTPERTIRNTYPNGAIRNMASEENSVQFDAVRFIDDSIITKVSMGAKYREETFEREVYRVDRRTVGEADPDTQPQLADYSYMVTDFMDNDMSVPHEWIAPDIQAYVDDLAAEGITIPALFSPQSSYSLERDILSVYAQADFETDIGDMVLRGNIGGRYETTDRDVNTYLTGEPHPDNGGVRLAIGEYTTSFDYNNFLPNLNMVLEITDSLQARFAAAKVLVRPILTSRSQIAPSQQSTENSFDTRSYSINLGQPEVEAMTADQVDLGLEYYYGEGDSVTLALFWKDIKNGTVSEYICPDQYEGISLSMNGSDCMDAAGNFYDIMSTYNDDSKLGMRGYELGWNQGLDEWLPIEGFGFSANYTYIDADDSDGYILSNSSEETWNLIGYWENETFTARVMLNHRSPYVQTQTDSFFARQGRVVDGRNQIDILLGYNVTENLNIRFGALNINGNDEDAYFSEATPVWQTSTAIGSSYYLSALYTF